MVDTCIWEKASQIILSFCTDSEKLLTIQFITHKKRCLSIIFLYECFRGTWAQEDYKENLCYGTEKDNRFSLFFSYSTKFMLLFLPQKHKKAEKEVSIWTWTWLFCMCLHWERERERLTEEVSGGMVLELEILCRSSHGVMCLRPRVCEFVSSIYYQFI